MNLTERSEKVRILRERLRTGELNRFEFQKALEDLAQVSEELLESGESLEATAGRKNLETVRSRKPTAEFELQRQFFSSSKKISDTEIQAGLISGRYSSEASASEGNTEEVSKLVSMKIPGKKRETLYRLTSFFVGISFAIVFMLPEESNVSRLLSSSILPSQEQMQEKAILLKNSITTPTKELTTKKKIAKTSPVRKVKTQNAPIIFSSPQVKALFGPDAVNRCKKSCKNSSESCLDSCSAYGFEQFGRRLKRGSLSSKADAKRVVTQCRKNAVSPKVAQATWKDSAEELTTFVRALKPYSVKQHDYGRIRSFAQQAVKQHGALGLPHNSRTPQRQLNGYLKKASCLLTHKALSDLGQLKASESDDSFSADYFRALSSRLEKSVNEERATIAKLIQRTHVIRTSK